jgi:flavin-dependent dehydrogenase
MRAAPLRLGGIGRSYADHLVVVGDAAGHIDPLTGEGIQYGLDAAEMAAETIAEAFAAGDWSAAVLRRYQERWMTAFGRDFRWARAMAAAYARYPIFLDAWAAIVRRRGRDFFMDWAEAMTGSQPKRSFLRPGLLLPITREALYQWWLGPGAAAARAAGGVGG